MDCYESDTYEKVLRLFYDALLVVMSITGLR